MLLHAFLRTRYEIKENNLPSLKLHHIIIVKMWESTYLVTSSVIFPHIHSISKSIDITISNNNFYNCYYSSNIYPYKKRNWSYLQKCYLLKLFLMVKKTRTETISIMSNLINPCTAKVFLNVCGNAWIWNMSTDLSNAIRTSQSVISGAVIVRLAPHGKAMWCQCN